MWPKNIIEEAYDRITIDMTETNCCENPCKFLSVSTKWGRRLICNSCGKPWKGEKIDQFPSHKSPVSERDWKEINAQKPPVREKLQKEYVIGSATAVPTHMKDVTWEPKPSSSTWEASLTDQIETCLDADAHGNLLPGVMFKEIEHMARRIIPLIRQKKTEWECDAVIAAIAKYGPGSEHEALLKEQAYAQGRTDTETRLREKVEGMKKEMVSHECTMFVCTHYLDVSSHTRALDNVLALLGESNNKNV